MRVNFSGESFFIKKILYDWMIKIFPDLSCTLVLTFIIKTFITVVNYDFLTTQCFLMRTMYQIFKDFMVPNQKISDTV